MKNKDKKMSEIFTELKNIAALSRRYAFSVIVYTVMAVFSIVFGLLSSLVFQSLIDVVTKGDVSLNIFKFDSLYVAVACAIAFTVFKLIFSAFNGRIAEKIRIKINTEMTAEVFDKYISSDWEYTSDFASGDILNRFNSDVSTLSTSVTGVMPTLITKAFQFLSSFFLIFYYDRIMALIALISVPVSLLCSRFLIKRMHIYAKKLKKSSSKLMSFNSDALLNMQYLKSFGLVTVFCKKLRELQKEYVSISLDYNKFSITVTSVISFVTQMITYACFGWGVYRLWTGDISLGTLVLFIQLYSMLSSSFGSVVGVVPNLINAVAASERISEICNLPQEDVLSTTEIIKFYNNASGNSIELSLNNVSFRYKDETENALNSINFSCKSGDFVALTGPSGEGKTTILRLLLSLVKCSSGDAFVLNSVTGDKLSLSASTRHLFSYVPQKNTMFGDTLSANMRMVKQDATDEEIINVLKIACAYDFVMKDKNGINCLVGDGGVGFSEGQMQRLSIARALLRDAPIILFDEATSALDIDTEKKVLENLAQWGKDKICIFTTHRSSVFEVCNKAYMITDCDCIPVLW